jgi:type II restriction enzyme
VIGYIARIAVALRSNHFQITALVAEFLCVACQEEYELKSQKAVFGEKVLDGSFRTKCERLAASNNPVYFF